MKQTETISSIYRLPIWPPEGGRGICPLKHYPDTLLESCRWPDLIWNKVRLWPWCSWRWCSGLAPPLPLGSSGSPGSQGLNSKQQTSMINRRKKTASSEFLQWSYWLGRMVLYLSLIMCPGTSSSAALTKFGGIFCGGDRDGLNVKTNTPHLTHSSMSTHAQKVSAFTNNVFR